MSERELNIPGSIQPTRGVNQRQSLVRVPDGFFSNSTGVQYGVEGYNVQRIAGKVLAGVFPANSPVLNYFVFNGKLIVQGLSRVMMTDATQLFSLNFTYSPFPPVAPTLSLISYYTLRVTTPPSFPLYATSYTLQRSTDNLTWTTLTTGLGLNAVYNDSGLTDNTLYYYRVLAANTVASTPGPSTSATTLDATVTVSGVTVTSTGIIVKGA